MNEAEYLTAEADNTLLGESVFAMRFVNFAVRNLLYGPKFQRKSSFRSSKSLYLGKKVKIKLQDVYQP